MIGFLLACTGATDPCPEIGVPEGACPVIFNTDATQDIYLNLSQSTIDGLMGDYTEWESRSADDRKPYHPVEEFRWGCETITNAKIRLKGNPCCSWQGDKLQFVVSFNKVDRKGRFLGLRKIGFDAPFYDPSLLSERLAFAALDDLNSASSCMNHTRLHINDALYGTYTLIEMVDKEYLQRRFSGEDDEGNMYKFDYGNVAMELRTNEEQNDTTNYDYFQTLTSYEDIDSEMDLDQVLQTVAGEAILVQADGYWAGSLNFYLYDHPTRGWQVFPWDMDHAFDFWAANTNPLSRQDYYGISGQLDTVIAHPEGRERLIDAVKASYALYDVSLMVERLDRWALAIRPDIEAEPHKPFTMLEHDEAVVQLRNAIIARDTFLAQWVQDN